jgi:hypothetical protein
LKSGSLNLLEPSGPAQACNGIALPFTFTQTMVAMGIFPCKGKFPRQNRESNILDIVADIKKKKIGNA